MNAKGGNLIRLAIDAPQPVAARAAYTLQQLLATLGVGIERNAARVAEWPNDVLPCVPEEWETTAMAPPGADPLALAFWHLARVEEAQPDVQRDAHGRTAYTGSWTAGNGDAPLDAPVDRVRELVRRWAHAHGVETASIWPGGRRFALALSHDVDGLRRLTKAGRKRALKRAARSIGRREAGDAARDVKSVAASLRGGHHDPYWTFDRIRDMERARDARSTYYFLAGHVVPEDGENQEAYEELLPEAVRVVTEGGDEVGLHPSYTSYETPGLVHAERLRLAGLVPDVEHVRYHYLRFDPHRHARELVDSGVRTDSTLGWAERPGFRSGFSFPYRLYDLGRERAHNLVEVPLVLMDGTLDAAHYLGLEAEAAWPHVQAVVDRVARLGGGAAVLWHNDYLDPVASRGYDRLYERLLDLAQARGGWLAPVGEVAGRLA